MREQPGSGDGDAAKAPAAADSRRQAPAAGSAEPASRPAKAARPDEPAPVREAAAPKAKEEPAPIVVPAGTELHLELATAVSSATSREGDLVVARLVGPVKVGERVVLAEGIQRFGHDQLTTFGIGADLSQQDWLGIFRQLISRGLLAVDIEGHGGLHLTEAARPVLRGEERLMLRRDAKPEKIKKTKVSKTTREPHGPFTSEADLRLWEALRTRRLELARAQGVPPYVVFHDSTLAQMVELRPQTLEELAHISGVGERKLEAYGERFLAVIRADTAQINGY